MNAKDWKAIGRAKAADQAVELELPSGMVIQARRPDPAQVAMWGRLPMGLASAALESSGKPAPPPDVEEGLASIELSRNVLLYCCVSPRISLTPGEDEIHPREIPDEDLVFLLRWAMRREEADGLRRFRDVGSDGGAGSHSEDVRPTPVDAAGDHGPDAGVGDRPRRGRVSSIAVGGDFEL